MSRQRIAILGAGPAGVGAAWRLGLAGKADVVVLERQGDVGGNAGTFEVAGTPVDYGSHRLHPASDPAILRDIQELLGDDLLDRPRHGRIRLRGRWLHFPLKPLDLVTNLPPSFSMGVARDMLAKMLPFGGRACEETFDSILLKGLGRTICRDFYFPYALKLWGLPTHELSPIQARRRVSAGSLGKMVRKVFSALPGMRKPGTGRFYYPRGGFGQITRAMADAASAQGAKLLLGSNVKRITLGEVHRIDVERDGQATTIETDRIWSTIPITALVNLVQPAAPQRVIEASQKIQYRGMILIYLVLATRQYTPFDAHYFPETDIPLSRMSEPKNYAVRAEPADRTVLCGELPCKVGDKLWNATDQELADQVRESLARCDLPTDAPVIEVVTRRLPQAYPIYTHDYEGHFNAMDSWAGGLDRVLTFGRQGLFAHDNTHHALAMSYAAVDCLGPDGSFDAAKWATYRRQFESHVVED